MTSVAAPSLSTQVVDAIRSVTGPGPVVLHEPRFAGNEWTYVRECLDSTFVSSVGKFVDRFENELAAFTGAKHVVAVVNGTAALHIALRLAGVERDDEVLAPALSFVATANAISYCGAIPHLVDSEERTLGLDPVALREYLRATTETRDGQCINRATARVIRAIVPMHTFGHPVDIEGVMAVARDFRLALVEDAAESLGSTVGGRHTGTFGVIGTLSFNGNKTITTGGGGALLINDAALARRAKHVTTTAKVPHRWEFQHDEIGYNYRLPNLNAALGCAQLEQLDGFLARKRRSAQRYREGLAGAASVSLLWEPAGARSNFWLNAVRCDTPARAKRLLARLNAEGFEARPLWTPCHRQPMFEPIATGPLDRADRLWRVCFNVPSSASLKPGDVDAVCRLLRRA